LLEANHALTSALGYRTVDELRALDFPLAVFESTDDLRWLIERCQNGPRQLADAILKKKDGTRLGMRLHAAHVSADVIEIVAEDLTNLRAAEDRLRKAHRMEAVGRLASEVAATCDNLLRDVIRSADELMASLGGDTPLRHQTEAIVSDVTRAAGFLRQLSAYGEEQARILSAVDVNKVLRELEPVLKRVAGDDIELVLPKKVAALNVDVDADRVERVLVNVAAYGRARMPSGGRLIVELARVAVDRNFVTKYPNVRQGGHALIRVTEVKATARMWPFGLRDALPSTAGPAVAERPGLDLGAMQTLIADCGGHLWMNAEPGGNMEVKIRLPLRAPVPMAKAQLARSGGKRAAVARWFQS
jgi:signal transduction histidine kinase